MLSGRLLQSAVSNLYLYIMPTEQNLQQATEHHHAGRLPEAEKLYRQILQAEPENADAMHRLGVLAIQTQNHQAAIELIACAAQIQPDNPLVHMSLGNAFSAAGRPDE